MSWSHVQTASNTGTITPNAKAFASNNTLHNLLVVAVVWDGAQAFTSLGDSQGNVYTQIGTEQTRFGFKSRIYYAKNCKAGANTVTLTIGAGSGWNGIYISEYSGLDQATPYITNQFSTNGADSGATTFTSNNAPTTITNSLLYGFFSNANYTPTMEGSWTQRSAATVYDKNAASSGNYAFTGTIDIADGYVAWVVAFVEPVAAAALAVQLAGASIGSAATHPIKADLSKTLSGTTVSASVGDRDSIDLSSNLAGNTLASGALVQAKAGLSSNLAGISVSSGATAPSDVALSVALEGSVVSSGDSVGIVAVLSDTLEGTGVFMTIITDSLLISHKGLFTIPNIPSRRLNRGY